MDKSWMTLGDRFSTEYVMGVNLFISFAKKHVGEQGKIRCPCVSCLNIDIKTFKEVEDHLIIKGISTTYTRWIYHGEDSGSSKQDADSQGNMNQRDDDVPDWMEGDDEDHDRILEMIEDVQRGTFIGVDQVGSSNAQVDENNGEGEAKRFEKLIKEAQQPLYPGCTKQTTLSCLINLLHMKVLNHWSNKSFNMMLQHYKDSLPDGETLPKNFNEARNMLRDIGLGYITIDVCKYDCALFWKEHENRQECPHCGESRWKETDEGRKKIPHKVLRYFPIIPRLQRLFMSEEIANDMRWHEEKRVNDNVLRHPADSEAWKDFNEKFKWFAEDCRNVYLALATDGFNPFGTMSNSYSMWPVILVPYNLPPWKCMKEPFLMMSLLIPGRHAPGKDIDVFLRPLIDDLKTLWNVGVRTHDRAKNEYFQMHAAVMWTINDFPAYGTLSAWVTKGYLACPTCNSDPCSCKLRSKIGYTGHRRFLPKDHAWRRSKKFDGKVEHRLEPKELSGKDVLEQMRQLPIYTPGKRSVNKKRKRGASDLNYTRESIFFELPYWKELKVRHNLDVMHIEKNICDNVLGTLLNMLGKTKDTHKARLDLEDMNIRKELWLRLNGDSYTMPQACYTLSKNDQKGFCEFLKSVKFPDGFASNVSRCVNIDGGSVSGLKSHDCHIMLQRLIPAGVRGYLRKDVSAALVELGNFFKDLCCKSLEVDVLKRLEKDIVLILCKLEMIYPPAFFDVMVHLAVHLPREAMLAGPVQFRWMYPIERFLETLKGYVRNKARPEGSIAEAYVVKECLTFCSLYLHGVETKFNRPERNYDGLAEENQFSVFSKRVCPFGAYTYDELTNSEYELARWYVLNNCEEIEDYLEEHKNKLNAESSENLEERHRKEFPRWFEKHMKRLYHEKSQDATDQLYALACGPDVRARRHTGCIVNGVRFHTKHHDRYRKTQNSGLVVKGVHDDSEIDFYGVVIDIIELDYVKNCSAVLFKCEWFDTDNKNKTGLRKDEYFTSVNITGNWYKNDPFVLAVQANQVFYINDTRLGKSWQVVQEFQHRHLFDVPERESANTNDLEGSTAEDMVYQEDRPSGNPVILEDVLGPLHREDEDPLIVNTDDVQSQRAVGDINLDESDVDETIIEYCDDEEDKICSDHDSDID